MATPEIEQWRTRAREAMATLVRADAPTIAWIRRAGGSPIRLGVFPASFNPPTRAHVEIIRRAREHYDLEAIALLPGLTNADKRAYEAALEDRVAMLLATFGTDPTIAIGVVSHPFLVDMILPLRREYATSEIVFLVGSDTFERLLDRQGRYLGRYYKPYRDRAAVLEDLFSASRVIVAARGSFTCAALEQLLEEEALPYGSRIACMELPEEVRFISATEVRWRIRRGESIASLVPEAVEAYIRATGLYR
ncbi:Nicotinate-nucleotide adenylyltransferase [bacterium HR10]|nr:Nicotinate-nucleotide adenylyltransferase [bacterium HR10]